MCDTRLLSSFEPEMKPAACSWQCTKGHPPEMMLSLVLLGLFCHVTKAVASVVQALKSMVERSWHKDPEKRPTFPEVVKILDDNMKRVVRSVGDSGQAAGSRCCSIQ